MDAPANVFLGREITTRPGSLDDAAMESATREVMGRLNPKFRNFKSPVKSLSGGQRQSVAIARAVHFNARILIMDEPTAALGPAETAQVRDLVRQLKDGGHRHLPDQPRHPRRIRSVGPDQRHVHGKLVGTVDKHEVTNDEVLAMIIMGKKPDEITEQELAELTRLTCALEPRGRSARGRGTGPR